MTMGPTMLFSSTVITLVKPHVCPHIVFRCLVGGEPTPYKLFSSSVIRVILTPDFL